MGLGKRLRCSAAISSTVLLPRRMAELPNRSTPAWLVESTAPCSDTETPAAAVLVSTTAFSTRAMSSPCSERWLRAARCRRTSAQFSGTSLIDSVLILVPIALWLHFVSELQARQLVATADRHG